MSCQHGILENVGYINNDCVVMEIFTKLVYRVSVCNVEDCYGAFYVIFNELSDKCLNEK